MAKFLSEVSTWLLRRLASLVFIIPYAVIAAASSTTLTEEIPNVSTGLSSNTNLTVLLPVKAGIVGVIAAALLAFWGFFWAEVVNENTEVEDYPDVVRSYRIAFGYFIPALILLFVSVAADFYLILVNTSSQTALAISFGTFASSLLMMGVFIGHFALRTLFEMNTMLRAGRDKN